MRVAILAVVLVLAAASAPAFTATRVCTLENGRKVRIDDAACRTLGGSTPSPSPQPTGGPPCNYAFSGQRTISFERGRETRLCVDVTSPRAMFDLQTRNHGNASCADYWMQVYSPTGAVSEPSNGVQPGAVIMPAVAGRYVAVVLLRDSNSVACSTLTFYER